MEVTDYSKIIASLSPEKRKLLALRLRKLAGEYNSFPLSFAQERFWFMEQLEPGSPTYNIPLAIQIKGFLDLNVFKRCINEIVRRHEVLRTSFTVIDGEPLQVISPDLKIQIPVVDLQNLPESVQLASVRQLAVAEAQRPFNLASGPLLRVTLLQKAPDELVVLFTMHHIISDGWSMGVLMREFTQLYQAFSSGQSSPLPELTLQYADFAKWQRQHLTGERLQEQLNYWQEKLGNNTDSLNLFTDFSRPAVRTNKGAYEIFKITSKLTERLNQFSQQEGCTLFMTLLAAFHVLLHRYTGQTSISVGSPIANRTRAETENLIGFFVNTLVLKTDLAGQPSFRELIQRVREITLGAYAHQDLPFEKLVETLQPERQLNRTPLFQVMFGLQNTPSRAIHLRDLQFDQLEFDPGAAEFDLTLLITATTDGLKGILQYSTEIFRSDTIQRMLVHFERLLSAFVEDPDRSIAKVSLLTQTEEEVQLKTWNETTVKFPDAVCMHQLFEIQTARTPEALAVVYENQHLSYQELNQRANQLAHYLRRLGVGPEVPVGIYVERSIELLVGIIGILKAGGAYVPLDPAYPQSRIEYILEDAKLSIVLALQRSSLPTIGENTRYIYLDSDWKTISRESSKNPRIVTQPENLAYLIYTSGSTGTPKGVMIQQRSAINLWNGLKNVVYDHQPKSTLRVSLNAPLLFDASVQQLVMLLSGHTVDILPQATRQDVAAMLNYIREHQIEGLDCVPSQLKLLLAEGLLDEKVWKPLVVLPGGEAIDEATWQMLRNSPDTEFYNMYGPTECTVDSTVCPIRTANSQPVIGKPINNAQFYIVDRNLQPVPVGVAGELLIGGAGLARGYLYRADLTAEKFIPNPFSSTPGKRLYRTGDLGRYRPDGNIEFLGRIDHQVKLRGFRIELGEIEAVLNQHAAVQRAVVLAREDEPGEKRLVAYFIADKSVDAPPDSQQLYIFLKEKLPEYMVPVFFVPLEKFPLTPSGKIDSNKLPVPENGHAPIPETVVPPRTPIEEMLVGIWIDLLKRQPIGIHQNFFELGGHSLLATQLISRLRDAFKIELPLRTLFESPTIANLAQAIESARQSATGVSAPPLQRISREGELPLSFAQQRLWFLDQLEPDSPLYNIPDAVKLEGSLNLNILQRCLKEIVRRHEVLRTTFQTIDGKCVLSISQSENISLKLVDLSELTVVQQETTIKNLNQAEAQRPFSLVRGPLFRFILLKIKPTEHIALLTMHHIIADAWSMGVLTQELASLYEAFAAERPSPLPELPLQYVDYAAWQRQWLQGAVLEAQVNYWKKKLSGAPPLLELPTDRPRPPVQTSKGDYITFRFPIKLSQALHRLSQQEGCTLFMTMLAAFQTLLYRYSAQSDISVGTPIANRTRSETENLIGFFVNTLVLRANFEDSPAFRTLLHQVKNTTLEAYAHQDIPFEKIVDALKPQRNLSHSPLFQVMLVIQNIPLQSRQLPDLNLKPLAAHSGTAKFDLTLFLADDDDALSGAIEYNQDLFNRSTINRMVQHFQTLLQAIVAEPEQSVDRLPLLSATEKQQVLSDWNATHLEYPNQTLLTQLFEAQAEQTPQAIAVRCESESLSYHELNQQANQLAHYLKKQGVGPEVLVGIYIERSPKMLIALLGILKAGGAYVPIDPNYPAERTRFVLKDAAISVLVTQARFQTSLPEIPCPRIFLDQDWPRIAREDTDNLQTEISADNLAYVIYTSGSTGKPKGTLLTHHGLLNYLNWCLKTYPLKTGKGSLVHSPLVFDATITGLFTPLLVGQTVTLLPETNDLNALVEALQQRSQYSLIKITPAHLKVLSQLLPPNQALDQSGAFIIGGENLTVDHLDFWLKNAPETVYINEYGPTETVVGCMNYQVPRNKSTGGVIPIGRPIANIQIYLLDSHLQPVPVGVAGEIYIGGAGLARGYLNRPDLTAEKFIPHPFSDEPGARLYQSGDRARYLPDGNIEFLGRIDHQVKIRGFRIEPDEIEFVLKKHPAVSGAVVVAKKQPSSATELRLVAYWVPQNGMNPTIGEFRHFLSQELPEYMLPSAFVRLSSIPLTPNGKIDLQALPEPSTERPTSTQPMVAPRTSKEKLLAEIWRKVLGIEQVGIHDNFFESGGDSILSIQVIARAQQAGLHLTPRQLFEYPTLAGLAAVTAEGPRIHAQQELLEGEVTLTPIQHWFLTESFGVPDHWNQSVLLSFSNTPNPVILKQAFQKVLFHHDVLRLRLVQDESGWRQYYTAFENEIPFSQVDLSELAEDAQSLQIENLALQIQASLNLKHGPLIRIVLFHCGSKQSDRLLIVVHHWVIDGVSWRILLEDLQTVLQQIEQGESIQLPPKTTSYQYWGQRLLEYRQSPKMQAESKYWQHLTKQPFLALPVNFSNGENTEASARTLSVTLDPNETQSLLQEVPSRSHTRIDEVLLTALVQAFAKFTGVQMLWVDLEGHGREDLFADVDLSRTVGWFTSIYSVFLDLRNVQSTADSLKQIKEQIRQIPEHGIGFGILKYLRQSPVVRALPKPQVIFNYLGQFDQTMSATTVFTPARENRGWERSPRNHRTHLIEITGGIIKGQLNINWTYSINLYRPNTIEQLATDYLQALREIIFPNQREVTEGFTPSDFTLARLNQKKLDQLLNKFKTEG